MKKDFDLQTKFSPAGDQPHAIKQLTQNCLDGLSHQTLLGVTGSGKTFTMAHVIENLGRPTMILAPNKTLAAQLYSEMRDFFPNNAIESLLALTIGIAVVIIFDFILKMLRGYFIDIAGIQIEEEVNEREGSQPLL